MRQTQIISTLLICATCIIGGLFALLSNYRSRPNRIVFFLTLFTAFTLPIQGILEYIDPTRVVFWARLDVSSTIILDVLTLLLACNFPRRLFSWKTELSVGLAALAFALLSLSPLMIAGGVSDGQTVRLETGALMPLYYVVDACITALILPAMIIQYKRGRKMDRLRIKYLLLGIGSIAAMISIVGLWLPLLFHIYQAVDYIPLVILLGAGFIAYDVVAYRLLSIRLVVARSVAYTLLLIFLASSYYFLALWVGSHILGIIKLTEVGQLYQVAVALMLVFLFQPVRLFFEKLTDRLFYKDHYDTQKVVNGFSKILVSEQELEPLLQRSLAFICEQLHIKSGHIAVYDQVTVFATAHYRAEPFGKMPALLEGTAILEADYLPDDDPKRLLMQKIGISVASPLISQKERVGMLLLGDKLSGDIYSSQDLSTLEIISQELAVAIQNARAYQQLRDAQVQLRKTDEMKSEFIALTSHNLRTPASTLKAIADMLSSATTAEERKKYILMLSEVSEDLGELVEELLVISSLEAGRQYKTFDLVIVTKFLPTLLEQAKKTAEEKGLTFTMKFSKVEMNIRASQAHLGMAIRSIVDNAVKFTKKGSITITTEPIANQCVITVTDTGVGIEKTEVTQLFTKFHRGTDYEQFDYSGVGVGLYLAKLVVEEHGGHIELDSQVGKGTTVSIVLPLASAKITK